MGINRDLLVNAVEKGMVVYRAIVEKPGAPRRADHLNPQTMEEE